jgi:ADP-heptose:LPS heptosyltransferase/GT2 family glycosyltransferase
MRQDMKFTLSLLTYNNLPFLKQSLSAILEHSRDFTLIVTDNASTDGTGEYLEGCKAEYGFHLILNKENVGYLPAHNAALTFCHTPFFAVLNDDLLVCSGWLEAIEEKFNQNPKLAICGARDSCTVLNEKGEGSHGYGVEYVEGSCLVTRSEIVKEHGLFSEDYRFMFFEDSDLSLRLRQIGYDVDVADIPVRHIGGMTTAKERTVDIEGYKIRNGYIFRRKWDYYLKTKKFPPPIILSKDNRQNDSAREFVIRRSSSRGDVLMATPVLRALKSAYPDKKITFLTQFREIADGNPHVDAVNEPYAGDACFYDLDGAYEKRPDRHIVASYAETCNISLTDWALEIHPPQNVSDEMRSLIKSLNPIAVIGIQTAPGWVGREWGATGFSEISKRLHAMGFKVALVGSSNAPYIDCTIDLRGATSIGELVALIMAAKIFVGVDSFPFHVAQAARTPSVAIFGSVDPDKRIIPGARSVGVTAKNVGCLGCHSYLPAPRIITDECLRGRQLCMERLRVDDIMEIVGKVIEKPS